MDQHKAAFAPQQSSLIPAQPDQARTPENKSTSPSQTTWGIGRLLSTVRRVLSPFPPSRLLTQTAPPRAQLHFKQDESPTRQANLKPSIISSLHSSSQSLSQSSSQSEDLVRKRKSSPEDQRSYKRTKIAEVEPDSPEQVVVKRAPTGRRKTLTPSRRSYKTVRDRRNTMATIRDTALDVPYVPMTRADPHPEEIEEMDFETEEANHKNPVPSKRLPPKRDQEVKKSTETGLDLGHQSIAKTATPPQKQVAALTVIGKQLNSLNKVDKSTADEIDSKKRKRVKIDDLKTIPSRRPGQSTGTFCLLDEFFDENEDSIELDESQIDELSDRPNKRARMEPNIFDMITPTSSPAKSHETKSTKITDGMTHDSSLINTQRPAIHVDPTTTTLNITGNTSSIFETPSIEEFLCPDTPTPTSGQQPSALQRKRSEAEKYKPMVGSRLREMQRLPPAGSLSTAKALSSDQTSLLDMIPHVPASATSIFGNGDRDVSPVMVNGTATATTTVNFITTKIPEFVNLPALNSSADYGGFVFPVKSMPIFDGLLSPIKNIAELGIDQNKAIKEFIRDFNVSQASRVVQIPC